MKTTKIMQQLIGKTYKEVVENLRCEEDDGDCCGWVKACKVGDGSKGVVFKDYKIKEQE